MQCAMLQNATSPEWNAAQEEYGAHRIQGLRIPPDHQKLHDPGRRLREGGHLRKALMQTIFGGICCKAHQVT
jgi:hypothetical protein